MSSFRVPSNFFRASRWVLFSFLGISTSHLTYMSPRPRPFRYWMPLPRRRKVVPLWVPSGRVYSTLPSMVGTVMLSPSTAWLKVMGMVTQTS